MDRSTGPPNPDPQGPQAFCEDTPSPSNSPRNLVSEGLGSSGRGDWFLQVPQLSLSVQGSTQPPLQGERQTTDLRVPRPRSSRVVKRVTEEAGHTDLKSSTMRPGVPTRENNLILARTSLVSTERGPKVGLPPHAGRARTNCQSASQQIIPGAEQTA